MSETRVYVSERSRCFVYQCSSYQKGDTAIRAFIASNRYACSAACSADINCRNANYKVSNGACELWAGERIFTPPKNDKFDAIFEVECA